jgi:hypothetical protein
VPYKWFYLTGIAPTRDLDGVDTGHISMDVMAVWLVHCKGQVVHQLR